MFHRSLSGVPKVPLGWDRWNKIENFSNIKKDRKHSLTFIKLGMNNFRPETLNRAKFQQLLLHNKGSTPDWKNLFHRTSDKPGGTQFSIHQLHLTWNSGTIWKQV